VAPPAEPLRLAISASINANEKQAEYVLPFTVPSFNWPTSM